VTQQKATIVVAGSTGLVGREVVRMGLSQGHTIIALVRKPGAFPEYTGEPRLTELLADFDKLDALLPQLLAFQPRAFISTLGTTIRIAGSQGAFARVDRDYVATFATLGRAAGATHFGLVSAVDAAPASANFYLKIKGEAEQAVRAAGYARIDIMRPSFLMGNRTENRIGEKLGIWATRLLSPFMIGSWSRYKPIRVEMVAAKLLAAATTSYTGVAINHYNEIAIRAVSPYSHSLRQS
jgi:uncharacterized protein YbjT (DUF2867 family)